ncbi:MAG TPA: bifunctional DNA-formamidopyrimidine glycosylase/DNA-(apurinic or apyrimidinic site) lyase [Burkholderiaceae bacterium]
MPELPEVEVTRLSFAARIAGARIAAVDVGQPLRWPLGCATASLVGRTVLQVRRRGKYLLLDLADAPGLLLLHLGMSGSLRFADTLPPPGRHDHFGLHTSHGVLRLNDPRRFGAVVYATGESDPVAIKLLGSLGPEPLSDTFDVAGFHASLRRRNAPIKAVLLAGEAVVGVGNIYASEALFLAGIHPATRASRIGASRAARLHAAIRDVLERAVQRGGSTLRDFSSADGQSGYFQLDTMVYDRAGEPCRVCGTAVRRLVQGQRASFFCVGCQH